MTSFAPSGAARVAYDVTGTGPPVLLVHAGVTDRRSWHHVVDGRPVDVPDRERVVLAALLERRGAVVSRATFLRAFGAEDTSDRALEATVARLRRRLGPAGEAIRTVRGRGYLLDADRSS